MAPTLLLLIILALVASQGCLLSAAPHQPTSEQDPQDTTSSSTPSPTPTSTSTATATTTTTTTTTTTKSSVSSTSEPLSATGKDGAQAAPLNETGGQTAGYLSELRLEPSMEQLVAAPPGRSGLADSEDAQRSPRSEREPIMDMFGKFFLKPRSHDDQDQKEVVRDGIIRRLTELGFEKPFLQKSRFEFRRKPATSNNMIGILPGPHRRTERDQIVLVGAHWDSATKAPGVDDNGSGSACLLEIARLLTSHRCSFNHTIMLVWFDYEEQGKFGSEFFVNDYLFPHELEKYKSKFIGAYILDMILVRDKENNTQTLPPGIKSKLTDFFDELEREKNRGDFLATWSRKTWDEPLEDAFRFAWQDLGFEGRAFKAMRPELPQSRLPNSEERFYWKDFFRSDHASFWFPPLISTSVRRAPNRTSTVGHTSLNAILLTDLGPWRRSYQKCYHSACDDEHLLTDGNLAFMQQVVDTLVLTLIRVGQGQCEISEPKHSQLGAGTINSTGGEVSTTQAGAEIKLASMRGDAANNNTHSSSSSSANSGNNNNNNSAGVDSNDNNNTNSK